MGLASVVLAICVPLIVPGLHPSKLFSSGPGIGGSGSGSSAAAIALPDTLQDTLRQLQDTRPTTMLTYTTSAPAQLMASDPPYLQTYVYDTLDASGQWTGVYTAGEQQASALPAPQGLTDPGTFPQYTIAVSVIDNALTSKSLPTFLALPYPATQVSTPAGSWLTDANLIGVLAVLVGALAVLPGHVRGGSPDGDRADPRPALRRQAWPPTLRCRRRST